MFRIIYTHKRKISFLLLIIFLSSVFAPIEIYALSAGPSQPEFQQFQQASASEMVDPFTGDFSYNIPLFELPGPNGGYPFNLAYQAGITSEQEASWVGLGWSLNAGAITRQMRGLPDDFKGDDIETIRYMDPNYTIGVNPGMNFEIFGADTDKISVNAALGYSLIYNNYRGFSYSVDGNIGLPITLGNEENTKLSPSAGFSLNSSEGLNLNAGLSISHSDELNDNSVTGLNFNNGFSSRYGLTSLSFGLSHSQDYQNKADQQVARLNGSFNHSISLASMAFTPKITHPLKNDVFTGTVKAGSGQNGFFPSTKLRVFTSTQNFKESYSKVRGYGYFNLQHAGDEDLMDFNREKDGTIRKELPNLPIPVLTHDIYSIKGQGVGGMFKPVRNDFGVLHDNKTTSVTNSHSADFEVGIPGHFGVGRVYEGGKSYTGKWDFDSDQGIPSFKNFNINSLNEPYYFQVRGEHTSIPYADYEAIGNDQPIGISFSNVKNPKLAYSVDPNFVKSERPIRNSTVVAITNEDLLSAGSTNDPVINLFKTASLTDRNADQYKPHHIAGYITTDNNGMRYVYALPVYNLETEEIVFNTTHNDPQTNLPDHLLEYSNGTEFNFNDNPKNKFYTSNKMPAYAHTYLLTAVVGPDYVDVDNNGVSQNDIGYWINFHYSKLNSSFNWKSPYQGAAFLEGRKYDLEDNKGSYQIGSKEIWYLDVAESKTHYAVFSKSLRTDNKSAIHPKDFQIADGQVTNITSLSNRRTKTKKLDSVQLFAKSLSNPGINGGQQLLKVSFDNGHYELCRNLPYGDLGKMTLKGIHFEYGKSSKELNKYRFEYEKGVSDNADYNPYLMDRWGFYKSGDWRESGGTPTLTYNRAFPYVDQTEQAGDIRNSDAAMWSIKKIHLPSGSTISVDYEMDDYAYVQHKNAMKMVPIGEASLDNNYLKIPGGNEQIYKQYYDSLKGENIYFKALINLKDGKEDFVTGYVKPISYDANGIKLAGDRNPIKTLAYQHIRTSAADLLNVRQPSKTPNIKARSELMATLAQELGVIFKGFDDYADNKNWADELDINNSWVRLPVISGTKYGGGHRVRRVIIEETNGQNGNSLYGQVYDYTITENGNVISSGVAANEPLIGGDENPLRTAEDYTETIHLHSKNNLFFEYPINEGSYPGAGIGYSKVSVMSLATANRADKDANYAQYFPDEKYGTTGKTVYEYHTAKEFPTITYKTEKIDKHPNLFKLIPLIGLSSSALYVGTQGYSIVNNDMHGKILRSSQFRLSDNNEFEPSAYASTEYGYRTKEVTVDENTVFQTDNKFYVSDQNENILVTDSANSNSQVRLVGVEYEMVMDARNSHDVTKNFGASFNVDLITSPAPIPLSFAWPNVAENIVDSKIAVSNKIVFKSGVLERITRQQDGATVTTTHYGWDRITGKPVLSKTITEYDDSPTYTKVTPAYHIYGNMGASYTNIGLQYRVTNLQKIDGKSEYEFNASQDLISAENPVLVPGDVVILKREVDNTGNEPVYSTECTAIYLGTYSGAPRFHCRSSLSTEDGVIYKAIIVRSGKRNHLMTDAGNITSLSDPMVNSSENTYQRPVVIPNN